MIDILTTAYHSMGGKEFRKQKRRKKWGRNVGGRMHCIDKMSCHGGRDDVWGEI